MSVWRGRRVARRIPLVGRRGVESACAARIFPEDGDVLALVYDVRTPPMAQSGA